VRIEPLAVLASHLLGVVKPAQRATVGKAQPPIVEQHSGGDQRAGERAATGLVASRHHPGSELAVERE
jgi:hypothetical protein